MAPFVFKAPDGKEFASKAEWRDYVSNCTNNNFSQIISVVDADNVLFI